MGQGQLTLKVLGANTALRDVRWRYLTQEDNAPSRAQIIKQISQYQVWNTFLKLARVVPKILKTTVVWLLLLVAQQNLVIKPCCCRYHILLAIGHGETKLNLTWKLPPQFPALTELEGAKQAAYGRKVH